VPRLPDHSVQRNAPPGSCLSERPFETSAKVHETVRDLRPSCTPTRAELLFLGKGDANMEIDVAVLTGNIELAGGEFAVNQTMCRFEPIPSPSITLAHRRGSIGTGYFFSFTFTLLCFFDI
jgi:hypothetical protein